MKIENYIAADKVVKEMGYWEQFKEEIEEFRNNDCTIQPGYSKYMNGDVANLCKLIGSDNVIKYIDNRIKVLEHDLLII